MKILPPFKKLAASNDAIAKLPLKRLPVEQVRAQVIQHLSESKLEMLKAGHGTKVR
jgi:hypothetical protein